MIQFDAHMLARIAEFFPVAINRAFDDYDKLVLGREEDDVISGVIKKSRARKVIIVHIQLLMKLWGTIVDAGVKFGNTLESEHQTAIDRIADDKIAAFHSRLALIENHDGQES